LFFAIKTLTNYIVRYFMNKIYKPVLLIFAFLAMFAYTNAQTQLEDVVNAIKANRVSDMTRYFDNIVPITINNVQNTYSRTQAELVLKDFFNKNTPQDINILNSGSPTPSSKFAIGDLSTNTGKYSIYILFKLKDNTNYMLQEIRLNKE
jgi:chromosomal replication initiation ATPase DnaA